MKGGWVPSGNYWVQMFGKGVVGTGYTRGGGSRVCFIGLNMRLKTTMPIDEGANRDEDVVHNRRSACGIHRNGNEGECVSVKLAAAVTIGPDLDGSVRWRVIEHALE